MCVMLMYVYVLQTVGVGDISNLTTHMITLMTDTAVGSNDDSSSSWDSSEIDNMWWGPIYPRPILYSMVPEDTTANDEMPMSTEGVLLLCCFYPCICVVSCCHC